MDRFRTLDTLVADLGDRRAPCTEFDVRIACFLQGVDPPADGGWDAFAAAGRTPRYTSVQDDAMLLVPPGWWWHISHLEAEVIPTHPLPDFPVSNSADYRFGGRPVSYGCTLWGDRSLIAHSIATAAMLARLGLLLKAMAKAEDRMYRVQTGKGAMIADRRGVLIEMPAGSWLTDDGRLIAHRDAFPQYDFLEPDLGGEDAD